ncbi:MAG: ParB/RepB/Spo0J family partition protein [Oscillospiraceae bacterium]|nr:ParB/RepB/Spo0J family partition protein [Oscillospiraceae bacterium]
MTVTKRRGHVFSLPLDAITAETGSPRNPPEPGALYALADSIEKYGVLQPITVRRLENGYGLVAGDRRLRAARMAGLTRIPCILVDADDTDSTVLALVENLHRRDLDFIQEAEALNRLISDHGLSREEAARRVGMTRSAVANKLRVLKLSGETLRLIRENDLTERHARALLRLRDEGQRRRVLDEIISRGLNVAKTEELIDTILGGKEKPPRPVFVIRDVRFFLNTVDRGVAIMRDAGIGAECTRSETDAALTVTVTIPKVM